MPDTTPNTTHAAISSEEYASTIAAQATPKGNGAIHIVRLSGPRAKDLLKACFAPAGGSRKDFEPWKMRRGFFHDQDGSKLDDVLCVYMPGPATYTGEDCAEIYCHGGQAIVSLILETLLSLGAAAARRGEFTQRAFLNGRMDLSQAEAVAELIAAPGKMALEQSLRRLDGELSRRVQAVRAALETVRVHMSLAVDFPDDEVEILARPEFLGHVRQARTTLAGLLSGVDRAHVVQNGAKVVLAGSVNAGKSSLMNALLGRSRALVTNIPGTTRDFIEESVLFADLPVRLVDTAGLRDADDSVESLGIELSRRLAFNADCLVLVLDGEALGKECLEAASCPDEAFREMTATIPSAQPVVVVWNKSDLVPVLEAGPSWRPAWCRREDGTPLPFLPVSAKNGDGTDALCSLVRNVILQSLPQGTEEVAPNERQAAALRSALAEMDELVSDIEGGQLYDLLSVRLDTICAYLDSVIGVGTPQDVLNKVFEGFCIGK